MIKKLFILLFTSILGFIGFSNATFQLFEVGLNSYPSYWDENYDVNFIPKGRFISTYLGTSKNIISLGSQYLIFWNDDGLYFYNPSWPSNYATFNQGYFQYIRSCAQISYDTTGDFLQHCTNVQQITTGSEIVSNFMKTIKSGDFVLIEDSGGRNSCGGYCTYDWSSIYVCFSSYEVGKSICFIGGSRSTNFSSYGEPYPFLNTLQLGSDVTFGNINRNILDEPPGFVPGSIEGSSGIGNDVSLTGNLMYNSCTKGYILNKLDGILGDHFCYAGTFDTGLIDNNFSGNTYIYSYGLKYRDMYKLSNSNGPYYSSYNDWYLGHYDMISRYKLGQYGNNNPFIGEPVAVYSYFNNLYGRYLDFVDLSTKEMSSYGVLNYCNLLFSDDPLDSVYSGQYFNYLCDSLNSSDGSSNITTGTIGDPEESFEVLPSGFETPSNNVSSGVVVSVDWSGTLSGNTNQNFNGITFINDFYQKLQSNFLKPYNGIVGIVPSYILVFLLALILFRFLSH